MSSDPRRLVLALGNELLRDDRIALAAVRPLAEALAAAGIDAVECSVSGMYIVDYLEGYDEVLLVDCLAGRALRPGTIRELPLEELADVPAGPSPHYIGLPHALHLARRSGIEVPARLDVLAIEVADPYTFDLELSPGMAGPCRELTCRIRDWIEARWGVILPRC